MNLDHYIKPIHPGFDARVFEASLRQAAHRLLLLDYDGTLAGFLPAERRDEAYPYPGVPDTLNRILANNGRTRVVIISGRSVAEFDNLLRQVHPLPEIWGIYGWERRNVEGTYYPPMQYDPHAEAALKATIEWAGSEDVIYEVKPNESTPVAISLHWNIGDKDRHGRSMGELERLIVDYTDDVARQGVLQVKKGSRVRELIIPGESKGNIVQTILAQANVDFPEGYIATYFGDSDGDEDAFAAIHSAQSSMGLLINNSRNSDKLSPGKTAADAWLDNPEQDLANVLGFWV